MRAGLMRFRPTNDDESCGLLLLSLEDKRSVRLLTLCCVIPWLSPDLEHPLDCSAYRNAGIEVTPISGLSFPSKHRYQLPLRIGRCPVSANPPEIELYLKEKGGH